jgi:hypothetical protein
MVAGLLGRVLTIEEVKQRMKDIREAAVHYGGVVHCGERGRDELVIVSARLWEEVTSSRQDEAAASAPADPYEGFTRALREGRLGLPGHGPEPRRRMPNLRDESDLSVDEMVRLAGPDRVPRRRRRSE